MNVRRRVRPVLAAALLVSCGSATTNPSGGAPTSARPPDPIASASVLRAASAAPMAIASSSAAPLASEVAYSGPSHFVPLPPANLTGLCAATKPLQIATTDDPVDQAPCADVAMSTDGGLVAWTLQKDGKLAVLPVDATGKPAGVAKTYDLPNALYLRVEPLMDGRFVVWVTSYNGRRGSSEGGTLYLATFEPDGALVGKIQSERSAHVPSIERIRLPLGNERATYDDDREAMLHPGAEATLRLPPQRTDEGVHDLKRLLLPSGQIVTAGQRGAKAIVIQEDGEVSEFAWPDRLGAAHYGVDPDGTVVLTVASIDTTPTIEAYRLPIGKPLERADRPRAFFHLDEMRDYYVSSVDNPQGLVLTRDYAPSPAPIVSGPTNSINAGVAWTGTDFLVAYSMLSRGVNAIFTETLRCKPAP